MTAVGEKLRAQIQQTHDPDGRVFESKSLLGLLQLFKSITSIISNEAHDTSVRNLEFLRQSSSLRRLLPLLAVEVMNEGDDKHTVTLSVLKEVKRFGWDAKVVLVLASFAMNHCLWMLAQMYSASSLTLRAKEHSDLQTFLNSWITKVSIVDPYYFYLSLIRSFSKRPKANQLPKPVLTKLFQAVVVVVERIIELMDLPGEDLQGNDTPYEKAVADIPVIVYHIVNIVIYCVAVINKFPNKDFEITKTEEKELTSYANQLDGYTAIFTTQIGECKIFLEETKVDKAYQIPIPEYDHKENNKALEFLIKGSSEPQHQNEAERIIELLKGKYVMLLVSDEDIPMDDVYIIDKITDKITALPVLENRFSILWIPLYSNLSNATIDFHYKFSKKHMKWLTVPHPSAVSKEAADFIKEKWHFQSKTIIPVMLDPQGMVLNINALHALSVWGDAAFPYNRSKERAQWKSETFTMSFILDGVKNHVVTEWINDGNYILLYGGDDIDWIQKFATSAKNIAGKFKIQLKLLYMGKQHGGVHEKTNIKINEIIRTQKLSNKFYDEGQKWFFWSRIRSMVISKVNLQRGSEKEDWVMRQVKSLLGYETERKWAVLAKGNTVVAHGQGSMFMEVMTEMGKEGVRGDKKFEEEFVEVYEKVVERGRASCCEIEFPLRGTGIPETLKCPNAKCKLEEMDMRIVFQCCHYATKKG